MEALDRISAGDMRKAITLMQSSARLHGASVTQRTLEEVAGKVPDEAVSDLVAAVKANSFDRASAAVNNLIKDGYPGLQLMMQFFETCLRDGAIPDAAKARIAVKLAEADKARTHAPADTDDCVRDEESASLKEEATRAFPRSGQCAETRRAPGRAGWRLQERAGRKYTTPLERPGEPEAPAQQHICGLECLYARLCGCGRVARAFRVPSRALSVRFLARGIWEALGEGSEPGHHRAGTSQRCQRGKSHRRGHVPWLRRAPSRALGHPERPFTTLRSTQVPSREHVPICRAGALPF